MHIEPRYMLIDLETKREVRLTTDEFQAVWWIAEQHNTRKSDGPEASAAGNHLSEVSRDNGGDAK